MLVFPGFSTLKLQGPLEFSTQFPNFSLHHNHYTFPNPDPPPDLQVVQLHPGHFQWCIPQIQQKPHNSSKSKLNTTFTHIYTCPCVPQPRIDILTPSFSLNPYIIPESLVFFPVRLFALFPNLSSFFNLKEPLLFMPSIFIPLPSLHQEYVFLQYK